MGKGIPLGAKLFLEGIEVPFIGATITCAVDRASIAYIDVVPLDEIKHIKPRTMVHLFVRDITDQTNNYPYILAWEGEVFGFSFGRTVSSRMFTIKAIDYSAYWDSALVYFFDLSKLGEKNAADYLAREAKNINAASKNQIAHKAIAYSTVGYYFQEIRDALDGGDDFLGAFIKVIESVGNLNDFYNLGEDRLRITDRFIQKSSGKLRELIKQQDAKAWIKGAMGRKSGFFPIRSMIQELLGIIFHDYITVPFPAQVSRDILKKSHLETKDGKKKTVGGFLFKPNTYMLSPPACNIFFPDEYSSYQFDRNFFAEPTRLTYRPVPITRLPADWVADFSYQPASFNHYVMGSPKHPEKDFHDPAKYQGDGDDAVPTLKDDTGVNIPADIFPGFWGDKDDSSQNAANNGKKKDHNFFTNAEMFKGVWAAFETEMPAVLSFVTNVKSSLKPEFIGKVAKYLLYKKRYQGRSLQITSHLKLSVVPGFPVLILDDSPARQSTIAYCESVTHRIYANQGGYTNCLLSYARDVEEQDVSSNYGADPIVPEWFDDVVFGDDTFINEATGKRTYPKGMSSFYQSLLGNRGSKDLHSVVNKAESDITTAVDELLKQYRARKEAGDKSLSDFIAKITRRDYIKLNQAFGFLGASSKDSTESQYMVFTGDRIQGRKRVVDPDAPKGGKTTQTVRAYDYLQKKEVSIDVKQTKLVDASDRYAQDVRRKIILRYQKKLKERRGFVG